MKGTFEKIIGGIVSNEEVVCIKCINVYFFMWCNV